MSALPATVFTADKLLARARQRWTLSELAGRTVELSGESATALVTIALNLVLCAQTDRRRSVWITMSSGIFYPPDADRAGVDLEELLVVRVDRAHDAFRAASRLGRSGGFDLIAADLTDALPAPSLPLPLHDRLIRIADHHRMTFLFLTKKSEEASSIASPISLRGHVALSRISSKDSQYECAIHITRDRQGMPGWRHGEVYRAPSGVR